MSSSRGRRVAVASVAAATLTAGVVVAELPGRSPGSVAAAADSSSTVTPNTVSVDGVGTAAGTPNALQLQLEVQTNAKDAASALGSANSAMSKVQSALRARGVAAADMQTSGLSLQPNYVTDSNGNNPKLTGFQADESLQVTLHSVATAGVTINSVVQAGGTAVRIDGVNLSLDADSAPLAQARAQAFADAKVKAQQYAQLAGRSLGAVVSMKESSPESPIPYSRTFAAPMASMAPVPVETGKQTVTVDVSVVWALQ